MKKGIYFSLLLVLFLYSCEEIEKENLTDNQKENFIDTQNQVLMLKVDYLTNKLEGGKELTFSKPAASFSIENQYNAPADFGNIKLVYKELNETLFDGSIVWMGKGVIKYPESILTADKFENVLTYDFVYPNQGFLNVFNPSNQEYDYNTIWSSVQGLVKVRQYLKSNKNTKVQLFLYTPSVGIGNPADWDWIIFVKN